MMLTVHIEGRDVQNCTLRVRVTEEQVEERMRYSLRDRGDIADDIARDRAAARLFGKGAHWRDSGQGVGHRGQVWMPAKGGGLDARTGVITMRVS